MKKEILISRMPTEDIETVLAALDKIKIERNRMRNCFFWGGEGNYSNRHYYEKRHSVPEVTWSEGGDNYACAFQVSCHCHYTRANTTCIKNDKPTNWTAIKASISRLKKIVEARKS